MTSKRKNITGKLETNKGEDLPEGKVIGIVGSASNALDNWQKQSWLEIKDWLVIFKVFILIGVTIFTIV